MKIKIHFLTIPPCQRPSLSFAAHKEALRDALPQSFCLSHVQKSIIVGDRRALTNVCSTLFFVIAFQVYLSHQRMTLLFKQNPSSDPTSPLNIY